MQLAANCGESANWANPARRLGGQVTVLIRDDLAFSCSNGLGLTTE
jgi:hypothetical protein